MSPQYTVDWMLYLFLSNESHIYIYNMQIDSFITCVNLKSTPHISIFIHRCDLCCISFRTHRSLLRHNAATHKQLPTDPNGQPFIQNNPSIPLGFNDLAFIDFSCQKFPQIAQVTAMVKFSVLDLNDVKVIYLVCNI